MSRLFCSHHIVTHTYITDTPPPRHAHTRATHAREPTLLDPGLATRLFTLFNCASVEGIAGQRFLEADWSVECNVGDHAAMAVVGVAFMLLYIVGIPLAMFLLLFKNRRALHDKAHPRHQEVMFELGGLFAQVSAGDEK